VCRAGGGGGEAVSRKGAGKGCGRGAGRRTAG
jgi:hypothetical protein